MYIHLGVVFFGGGEISFSIYLYFMSRAEGGFVKQRVKPAVVPCSFVATRRSINGACQVLYASQTEAPPTKPHVGRRSKIFTIR